MGHQRGDGHDEHTHNNEPSCGFVEPDMIIQRDKNPICEFTENRKLILGGFPWLFVHGRGIETDGTVSSDFVERIMMHYTNKFAQDNRLLFLLFNQSQRHAASRRAVARVKSNSESIRKFTEIVNSENFEQEMQEAMNHPESTKAKFLAQKFLECIHSSGCPIPCSPAAQAYSIARIYALRHYFGQPAFFFSLSPDDFNSPLIVRFCCPGNNTLQDPEIVEALANPRKRVQKVCNNPIAAANFFERVIKSLFSCLFRMKLSSTTKRNHSPISDREIGVFGVPLGYSIQKECQNRGSLHFHAVLWVAYISPDIIQHVVHRQEIANAVARVIDSIITASLPEEAHEQGLERRRQGISIERPALSMSPIPNENKRGYLDRIYKAADAINKHLFHTASCKKMKSGQKRCRMRMPRGLFDKPTCVTQLYPIEVPPYYQIALKIDPPEKSDNPFVSNDKRILAIEHSRPHLQDQFVVEFNAPSLAAVGCNNNLSHLGSAMHSSPIFHYITKYVHKDLMELQATLSAMFEARKMVKKYPSVAADSHTTERTSIHILTRVLNSIAGKGEVPATLAATSLMGYSTSVFSHEFNFCFAWPAIQYVKQLKSSSTELDAMDESKDEINEDDDEINENDENDENGELEDKFDIDDVELDGDNGLATIIQTDQGLKFIQQHLSYAHRGENLHDLSLYEYIGIVSIVKKDPRSNENENENDNTRMGRRKNATFEFQSGYDGREKYIQVLRSKHHIPILAGKPPPKCPRPGGANEAERKNSFAKYVSTVFLPWNADNPPSMSFDDICNWATSATSFVDRCRIECIKSTCGYSGVTKSDQRAIMQWQSRGTKDWNDNNVDPIVNDTHKSSESLQEADQKFDVDTFIENMRALSRADTPNPILQNEELYITAAEEIVQEAFDFGLETAECTSRRSEVNIFNGIGMIEEIRRVAGAISIGNFDSDNQEENMDQGLGSGGPSESKLVEENLQFPVFSSDITLTREQNSALEYVLNWLNGDRSTQLFAIILGGPGTGKSTFCNALISSVPKGTIVCCAPTGIASSLIAGAKTAHSLLSLPIKGNKLGRISDKRMLACQSTFQNAKILLIDECSMLSAAKLAMVDARLKFILGNDRQFGGLSILLVGDLFQIPPCNGLALYKAVLMNTKQKSMSIEDIHGAVLFEQFLKIEFKQQMRACEDEWHTKVLESMRAGNPITPRILNGYQRLSRNNLTDSDWLSAPVVVSSNKLRQRLTIVRLKQFATRHGLPILKWRNKITFQNEIQISESDQEWLYQVEPGLFSYFVQGAMAYLTKNINPEKGLANGTLVTLHSIVLHSNDLMIYQKAINLASPGEVVEIKQPQSVNISLVASTYNWPTDQRLSFQSDQVILPLTVTEVKSMEIGYKKDTLKFDCHRLAFLPAASCTYHKIQGLTLSSCILHLQKGKGSLPSVNFSGLYVGLSRVRKASDIRIIASNDMQHIYDLRPNEDLMCWLKGFDDDDSSPKYWNRQASMRYKTQLKKNSSKVNKSKKRSRCNDEEKIEQQLVGSHKISKSEGIERKRYKLQEFSPKKTHKSTSLCILSDDQVSLLIHARISKVLIELGISCEEAGVHVLHPMTIDLFIQTGERNRFQGHESNYRIVFAAILINNNHWTLLCFNHEKDLLIYFDSMGNSIPHELEYNLANNYRAYHIIDMNKRVQTDGVTCGMWVAVTASLLARFWMEHPTSRMSEFVLEDCVEEDGTQVKFNAIKWPSSSQSLDTIVEINTSYICHLYSKYSSICYFQNDEKTINN